ncbi:MAG TPA: AMP-binding protein [Pararhodobacter sp.]|uniref:class I adenylate-forming enzyme family protein n=1 Tax=Pararhodobacter sp. TaxID=2127056 RepID=UPI001D2215CC|nr:AMP-binding protein [Pararhodobacter sp.]MCB1346573.1 AMP-binding protein [Paracoccaceae bacterium]HPD93923.1 AMP-binding protein [Pararhodobacter sp.]
MTPLLTIGQMLSTQARLQPDRIGARDLERAMTFAAWNARACRLANGLLALGLSRGDRIAVLAYNRVEWADIYAAVAKAGLVAVPVNFRLTAPEAGFICADCSVSAVIAEAALADLADAMRPGLTVPGANYILIGDAERSGWQGYEALIATAPAGEPGVDVTPDDTWCLMYTSGTTGNPKGAIRSHRGMAMLAFMTQVELGLTRGDDALLVMPMCHANSLNFFTAFLGIGATVTIFSRPNFDAALCLRTIGATGVTFSSLTPTHYMMMLDVPAAERGDAGFERVAKLMVSSAPARVETKRAIMAMFPNSGLYELYGSTEAGWVTFLHPDELFDHLGTVGREVVGSAPIRLLDDAGNEVPDGQPGELYSCGPYAFEGYWNLPDKTAEAFRGAYLSVGDMAIRDEHGFIRLIDRKKNMIISGGENVYPTEVEAVLAQHPDVKDVAVVGRPDDIWGERVAAAVVLRDGAALHAEGLIAWSRDRLAGYKRPREILFLSADEMPRNTTGKILHRVLHDRFAGAIDNGKESR